MLVLGVAFAWLSLSGLVSLLALRRGLPPVEFFAISILISPVLALPFAVIFRDPEKLILAGKARRCPYCQHVVKIKIEICPHCGLEIPSASKVPRDSAQTTAKASPSTAGRAAAPAATGSAATAPKGSPETKPIGVEATSKSNAPKLVKTRASEREFATRPPISSRAVRPAAAENEVRRPAVSPWKKPSTIAAMALVAVLMFTGVALLVRASRHRAAAAAPDLFQAEVAATTLTWVALFSDDERVFVGMLEPGKSMVFSAKQKLAISAEMPDHVNVKVNGTPTAFAGQQFSTLIIRKGEPITRAN
jgi:hypothetical protein